MTPVPATLTTEENLPTRDDESWVALLARISQQSVVKHFDAYADIDWDSPGMFIDPSDPRWGAH